MADLFFLRVWSLEAGLAFTTPVLFTTSAFANLSLRVLGQLVAPLDGATRLVTARFGITVETAFKRFATLLIPLRASCDWQTPMFSVQRCFVLAVFNVLSLAYPCSCVDSRLCA